MRRFTWLSCMGLRNTDKYCLTGAKGGVIMKACEHYREYSARYGLKQAQGNLDEAQQIAEIKYRNLVGREILFSEIYDIHNLMNEMRKLDVTRKWPLQNTRLESSFFNAQEINSTGPNWI